MSLQLTFLVDVAGCTGEGRARAKARGVKMGCKPTLTHHQQQEAIKRLKAGPDREPLDDCARLDS